MQMRYIDTKLVLQYFFKSELESALYNFPQQEFEDALKGLDFINIHKTSLELSK